MLKKNLIWFTYKLSINYDVTGKPPKKKVKKNSIDQPIKINCYLVSHRKFLKIKYTSGFNASYHTSAKVNCTKLQSNYWNWDLRGFSFIITNQGVLRAHSYYNNSIEQELTLSFLIQTIHLYTNINSFMFSIQNSRFM